MVCMDAQFRSSLAIRFRVIDEEGLFRQQVGILQHLFKDCLVRLGQMHLVREECLFEIVVHTEATIVEGILAYIIPMNGVRIAQQIYHIFATQVQYQLQFFTWDFQPFGFSYHLYIKIPN